jgi:hypothetical protein
MRTRSQLLLTESFRSTTARSRVGAAADDIARRVGGPQHVLALAAREEVDAGTADDPVVPPRAAEHVVALPAAVIVKSNSRSMTSRAARPDHNSLRVGREGRAPLRQRVLAAADQRNDPLHESAKWRSLEQPVPAGLFDAPAGWQIIEASATHRFFIPCRF